jgi:hypothetical protein
LCLGDQHAVERIPVVRRQAPGDLAVLQRDRERLEAGVTDGAPSRSEPVRSLPSDRSISFDSCVFASWVLTCMDQASSSPP